MATDSRIDESSTDSVPGSARSSSAAVLRIASRHAEVAAERDHCSVVGRGARSGVRAGAHACRVLRHDRLRVIVTLTSDRATGTGARGLWMVTRADSTTG